MSQIHELMPKVKAEIGHIGKNGKHPQGYKFRKIEDEHFARHAAFSKDSIDRLVKAGRIADTIIVGIWNSGEERYAEYYPEKFLAFAPEAVRRVCERFFRADTSGSIPGTGLGMAIVKEIVDLLGGRLAIESAPQQGTTVRIVLPLAAEPAPIAEAAEPAPL